jgi:hypothetical protein
MAALSTSSPASGVRGRAGRERARGGKSFSAASSSRPAITGVRSAGRRPRARTAPASRAPAVPGAPLSRQRGEDLARNQRHVDRRETQVAPRSQAERELHAARAALGPARVRGSSTVLGSSADSAPRRARRTTTRRKRRAGRQQELERAPARPARNAAAPWVTHSFARAGASTTNRLRSARPRHDARARARGARFRGDVVRALDSRRPSANRHAGNLEGEAQRRSWSCTWLRRAPGVAPRWPAPALARAGDLHRVCGRAQRLASAPARCRCSNSRRMQARQSGWQGGGRGLGGSRRWSTSREKLDDSSRSPLRLYLRFELRENYVWGRAIHAQGGSMGRRQEAPCVRGGGGGGDKRLRGWGTQYTPISHPE